MPASDGQPCSGDAAAVVRGQQYVCAGEFCRLPGDCTSEGLRLQSTGRNFRTTAVDLVAAAGVPVEAPLAVGRHAVVASADQLGSGVALTCAELEEWIREEKEVVTAHLGVTLTPDPRVHELLTRLSQRFGLAAVSSSATARLDACFTATGLDSLMPRAKRFSAEDSLPVPTSKPDPAVYVFAGNVLGIQANQALAIEDSAPGALSAVAAGFTTIGNVSFVPPPERARRSGELRDAGASAVMATWAELDDLLSRHPTRKRL